MSVSIVLNWLASTPDFAVPYALAALGLIISERAGVLSLGAEGLMLVGALAGIGAQIAIGQPAVSLVLAMLAAGMVSVLFAVMVIWLRVNQVIAGLALVFFCQGLTALVGSMAEWTNHATEGIGAMGLWPLSMLPGVGRLFEQNAMVWLTLPIFCAVAWFFARTSTGLRLRAVGENPQAADAAGIRVAAWRFAAVLAGSALVGLAGAVLFGCIEALIPQLAAAGVQLPQYFVMMTPYAVTLGVMVWVALSRRGADEEPGALGQPYVREERR